MKNLQEVFDALLELKNKKKQIQKEYRDALSQDKEYTDMTEQTKEIKTKKKQIETSIQQQMGQRYEELEKIAQEIKEQEQMISDITITNIMNGKSIEVKDKYNNSYEPIYKVTLKKENTLRKEQ